jgi:hypothetical protein
MEQNDRPISHSTSAQNATSESPASGESGQRKAVGGQSTPTPTPPSSPTDPQAGSPTAVVPSPSPAVRPPIVIPRGLGTVVSLTPDQQVQLQSCEAILQLASHTFVEAGLALAEIQDDELFIDEFGSFETYCREKWQYGKRYAERLMAAAEVVKRLRTNSSLPSPSYEGQVRPLMGLSAEQAMAISASMKFRF